MGSTTEMTYTPLSPSPQLPEWLNEYRQDAWKTYNELQTPTKKTEKWRFGSPDRLDFQGFSLAHDLLVSIETLDKSPLPKGISLLSYEEAVQLIPNKVQTALYTSQTNLGSEKYRSLCMGISDQALVIYVEENVQTESPILLSYKTKKDKALYSFQIFIISNENSHLEIIEDFSSENDEDESFILETQNFYMAKNSSILYASHQNTSLRTKILQIHSSQIKENASLKTILLNQGASWFRQEFTAHLLESQAKAELYSSSILKGNQEGDQRTKQNHYSPHTQSDLLFKNAVYDSATSIFSGMILVQKDAHYTKAYQSARNLVLSDNATTHALPGLEIKADNVACSHGTANSGMDEEELFYLLSRGIPRDKAETMIAQGFSKEIFQKLEDGAFKTQLLNVFFPNLI